MVCFEGKVAGMHNWSTSGRGRLWWWCRSPQPPQPVRISHPIFHAIWSYHDPGRLSWASLNNRQFFGPFSGQSWVVSAVMHMNDLIAALSLLPAPNPPYLRNFGASLAATKVLVVVVPALPLRSHPLSKLLL